MCPISINNSYFDVPPGHGTPIQARCPVHGPFTGWVPLDLRGHEVSLHGNAVPCPKCRAVARLDDGYFNFINEIVHDLHGVQLSRQVVRRFAREMERVSSKEQAVQKAEASHPILALVIKKAVQQPSWLTALTAVAAIVGILQGAPGAIQTADQAATWVWEKLQPEKQQADGPHKPQHENQHQDDTRGSDPDQNGRNDRTESWDDDVEV